jgi:hypothetical protein
MEWVGRRLPLAHLSPFVMAAKAAIHDSDRGSLCPMPAWIPAFAGMTMTKSL